MAEINHAFWEAIYEMYPKPSDSVAIRLLLSDYGIDYSSPNKGAYKIKINKEKCKALMFYPKSGKLVIQLNGKNAGSRYFCDRFFRASCWEKSAKITRPLFPAAAPIRPRHLVPTQQGVGT